MTPPAGSKQQQRASELANTVYAGVKHKMSAMKNELVSLREASASLKAALQTKEEEAALAAERSQAELDERLAGAHEASEATLKQHLEFIDRLLADKQELAKQCESLTGQMRGLEERYATGEAKREEAYARELKKQKELWGVAEKAKREQWLAEKTKEIKESTVRGLEPDIQRLVQRHRDEARKIEEALREEHRREMASERARSQRELARMQEVGIAERHAATEREREQCAQRLQEMSMHFEEQLRQQRARQASAASSEQEERDEGRRREISRLEDDLRAAKAREDAAVSSGRVERQALQDRHATELSDTVERERRAGAEARAEWEAHCEDEVKRRLEREKGALESAAAAARAEQISVVVNRLGSEMVQAEQQWQGKLDAARAQADARVADAQRKADAAHEDVRSRYVASVEAQSQLEARLRAVSDELAEARQLASASAAEAERARGSGEATAKEAREACRLATLEVSTALAAAQGERAAMADELAQLRAEQRAMLSSHEAQLASQQTAKEAELAAIGERVRSLERNKDEAIRTLQAQVGGLQSELHTTREQLHATQQEILSFQ